MKMAKKKMSILIAGFINGFTFFPNCNHNSISKTLGSLKIQNLDIVDNANGAAKDLENLTKDWMNVRKEIMYSFTTAQNELTQKG